MIASEQQIVLAQYPIPAWSRQSASWFAGLSAENFESFTPIWPTHFPYLAPHGHNSVWEQ